MENYKSNNKTRITTKKGMCAALLMLVAVSANAGTVNFQAVDENDNPLFTPTDWQINDGEGKPLMRVLGRHRFSFDLAGGVYSLTLTCPGGVEKQAVFSAPRDESVVVRCSG